MTIKQADISQYNDQALITLTYDDGQKSDFDVALPIHLDFNMQASFGIIAERTIKPSAWTRYMEPWQVTEASQLGVEICSHSFSHPRLTEVDDERLDAELKVSKEILDGLVGKHQKNKVTTFCIPYSASDGRVIAAAHKHYDVVRGKGNKFTPVFPTEDQSIVFSFGLKSDTQLADIKALIDEAVAKKKWLTLMLHGVVLERFDTMRDNDIDAHTLKGIIAHIKDIGKEMLLPINLSDIHAVRARAMEFRR